MRVPLFGLVAAIVVALVAACSTTPEGPPQVQFAAAGSTVTARPTQYCNLEMTDCHNDDGAPVELRIPAGTPLQVTVPDAISSAPWQVVFAYRDGTGALAEGKRTSVFAPGTRTAYTLELPAPADRLVTAQVQQFGAPPEANDNGGVDFPIRASWVLTATP